MANTTVNPTRMELTRLKGRLKTATPGPQAAEGQAGRADAASSWTWCGKTASCASERGGGPDAGPCASLTVAAAADVRRDAGAGPAVSQAERGAGHDHQKHHVRQRAGVSASALPDGAAGDIYPYGFAMTSGELDGAVDALASRISGYAEAGADRKDHASCWRRRSKRPAAASTRWNTS